jgi:hypothetical protein
LTSGSKLETSNRELTGTEREEFIMNNNWGFLAFAGDKPYAIPVSYVYRRGTFIIGLATPGRKMDYIERSCKVSFTISKPHVHTSFREPCTGVMVEGELEEVTDRAYYGMDKEIPEMPENLRLFKINVDEVGSKKCTNIPCRVFTTEVKKGWISPEVYARQVHEGKRVSN